MSKSLSLASKPTAQRQPQFEQTRQTVALVAREEGYVVTETDDSIMLGDIKMTATSLELPTYFTEEDAEKLAKFYRRIKSALMWWIGDLANVVNDKYGEKYKAIMRLTGFSYGRCRNIASVAKSIHLSLRSDKLSFGHHIEIAKIDDDGLKLEWINHAVKERLSVRGLRTALKDDTPASQDKATRNHLVAMIKSEIRTALYQYNQGSYASRTIPMLKKVVDAMERKAAPEEILEILKSVEISRAGEQ